MNPITRHPLLLRQCYSDKLQQAFAELSGDCNPIHVDSVAARRTLVGDRVVHGIHQALSAMEAMGKWMRGKKIKIGTIEELSVRFQKPVLVGQTVHFHLIEHTPNACKINGTIDGAIVSQMVVRLGLKTAINKTKLKPLAKEKIAEWSFEELSEKSGSMALGLDTRLAKKLFPIFMAVWGDVVLAEILALTRLVGMRCPGMHSLFGQVDVRFSEKGAKKKLDYRVAETDARFAKVLLDVEGPSIQGRLTTFVRPKPEQQPSIKEIGEKIKAGCFAGRVALIVGGSRGLGEVTAKIIAAGGGLPIITYHRGAEDAKRIKKEILSAGGRCQTCQFDVRAGKAVLQNLFSGKEKPRSLYYFATPRIFGRRRGFFDFDLLRDFTEVYVTAFGHLIDFLSIQDGKAFPVFYPSSVAVTEGMREMAEYAMAKKTGEELCAFYKQYSKRIKIVVERLPRIKTDQTSTLLQVPAQSGLEIMLPIINRIEVGDEFLEPTSSP